MREEMQKQEFTELTPEENYGHRTEFRKQSTKDALRAEWEKQTGQKWPTYEVQNPKTGKLEPKNYDMHHIIQNNHGGPHEWWNMHPALPEEHQLIHGRGGVARQIFNAKK